MRRYSFPQLFPEEAGAMAGQRAMADARRVFVVYGRDQLTRKATFDFLRSLGLKPLEWSEAVELTASAAPFVGDVLTAAFDAAQAVVVLMTPDDLASLRPEYAHGQYDEYETRPMGQPRPNVLFEAGMALGLHPDRTVIVQFGPLRPFSDIGGRHILRFDGSSASRQLLMVRLEAAGCEIDRKGTDWLNAGDFRPSASLVDQDTPTSESAAKAEPPASSAPELHVKVSRSADARYRFVVTNRGPGMVKELYLRLLEDVPILLFDGEMPLKELPEGDSLSVPAAAVGSLPRSPAVKVLISGELETGEDFTRTIDCKV